VFFLCVNFARLLVQGEHNKEGRIGKGWKTFVVVIIGNLHWICANLFCLYNLRRFFFCDKLSKTLVQETITCKEVSARGEKHLLLL
jgi:hypothetical protein